MTDYLRAASDRYNQDDSNFIAPISKVDANIISELHDIFEKIGLIAVTEILGEYKLNDDKETLRLLKDVKKQIKKPTSKEEFESKPHYIKANGRYIDMRLIYGFDSIMFFDESGRQIWGILLNPTPDEAKNVPYYSNTLISFEDESECSILIGLLDKYLVEARGGFINDIESNEG